MNSELDLKLRSAVSQFWSSRETQAQKQGIKTGIRDAGARTAVTGGSQMDGFVALVRDLLEESGVDRPVVYCERHIELPGWFRPEKKWDLLVVVEGCLIAAIEFKSQVGSFGNNFNNRTEEALGSAADLWAAYREGAFKPSTRPWLGFDVAGGCSRFHPVGKGAGATLQSVRRIQGCVIREALRDSFDEVGSREIVRCHVLSHV